MNFFKKHAQKVRYVLSVATALAMSVAMFSSIAYAAKDKNPSTTSTSIEVSVTGGVGEQEEGTESYTCDGNAFLLKQGDVTIIWLPSEMDGCDEDEIKKAIFAEDKSGAGKVSVIVYGEGEFPTLKEILEDNLSEIPEDLNLKKLDHTSFIVGNGTVTVTGAISHITFFDVTVESDEPSDDTNSSSNTSSDDTSSSSNTSSDDTSSSSNTSSDDTSSSSNTSSDDTSSSSNTSSDDTSSSSDDNSSTTTVPDDDTPTTGGGGYVPRTPSTPSSEVEVLEESVPMAETPSEELPLVEMPEEEVPMASAPETVIEEEPAPLADVPKTGDTPAALWTGLLIASLGGFVLAVKKRSKNK